MREVSPLAPPAGRSVAVLLSTMRSGSTLLKALLAQAPDVCDLPETDFQRYADPARLAELWALGEEPILLLKRPAWFNETRRYPRLPPVAGLKRIVLVRDAYANLLSIRKMAFRHLPFLVRTGLGNRFFTERYWQGVNRRLVDMAEMDPGYTWLVRYEDLQAEPERVTAELFRFLGSTQREGIKSYAPPKDYQWTWGKDDGGPTIRTLEVQAPKPPDYADRRLLAAIKGSDATQRLRRRLAYPELP